MVFINTPYAFLYYSIMVSLMTNTYFWTSLDCLFTYSNTAKLHTYLLLPIFFFPIVTFIIYYLKSRKIFKKFYQILTYLTIYIYLSNFK